MRPTEGRGERGGVPHRRARRRRRLRAPRQCDAEHVHDTFSYPRLRAAQRFIDGRRCDAHLGRGLRPPWTAKQSDRGRLSVHASDAQELPLPRVAVRLGLRVRRHLQQRLRDGLARLRVIARPRERRVARLLVHDVHRVRAGRPDGFNKYERARYCSITKRRRVARRAHYSSELHPPPRVGTRPSDAEHGLFCADGLPHLELGPGTGERSRQGLRAVRRGLRGTGHVHAGGEFQRRESCFGPDLCPDRRKDAGHYGHGCDGHGGPGTHDQGTALRRQYPGVGLPLAHGRVRLLHAARVARRVHRRESHRAHLCEQHGGQGAPDVQFTRPSVARDDARARPRFSCWKQEFCVRQPLVFCRTATRFDPGRHTLNFNGLGVHHRPHVLQRRERGHGHVPQRLHDPPPGVQSRDRVRPAHDDVRAGAGLRAVPVHVRLALRRRERLQV